MNALSTCLNHLQQVSFEHIYNEAIYVATGLLCSIVKSLLCISVQKVVYKFMPRRKFKVLFIVFVLYVC